MESSGQDSKGTSASGTFAKGNIAIEMLTVAAMIGAVLMITSEFLDLFNVTTPAGGEISAAAKTAGENHGYALLVIGLVGLAGIALARLSEQWLPAAAVAVLSLLALMIVLLGDLPDTNDTGLTAQRRIGTASPALGLWIELVGSLALAIGSGGIAWMLRRSESP